MAGVQAETVPEVLPLRAVLSVSTLPVMAVMVVPAVTPAPVTVWPMARPVVESTVTEVLPTFPVVAVMVAVLVATGATEPAAAT